ncbi:hypothetical protein [Helicobacter sp. MIT 99-5507]|uniref:hypothetical protein n=1 Tax=Helicobacter sp. MIT 99-5507 TaxID=152489 RepID=UPI000E1F61A6|nr:hypothetical protein [Helicobacter sp. MIT 99-5507]RDU57922.1 hypothetical protein CQA42_03220 [Helicobacter sp. MIT 99-5507]
MELFLKIFYYLYVAVAITPFAIIFILKNSEIKISIEIWDYVVNNYLIILIIFAISLFLSWLYIVVVQQCYKDTQSEQICSTEIEIAEPKYIPIYITYFVIALSIPYSQENSIHGWILFSITYLFIWFLILKGKFSFFNPYLLICGFNFYEATIDSKRSEYARYKIFLISKQVIKNIKQHDSLIRLNDFTYLDKGEYNG